MVDNNYSVSFEDKVIVGGEQNGLTNGSICVNTKTRIIYFKPGHTYTDKIQLLNVTVLPQIIWIQPPDSKIFKFPNLTTVSIPPGESWDLHYTFMSNLNQKFKSYLHLKNPTGQGNLAIELKAVPRISSSLPRTINFGHVNIGMSVTKKLSLTPESKPYQFRIFIPNESQELNVNPTFGKVSCDSSTYVTIRYTPRSYITLCSDLIFYHSEANQEPQVITITAVTKPRDTNEQNVKMEKREPTKIDLSPRNITHRRNIQTQKDNNTVFSRLKPNKIFVDKTCTIPVDSYSWNNALGEPDEVYREAYAQHTKTFLLNAKLFGNTNKNEKLYSYRNVSYDDNLRKSTGLRERSIRMNHIDTSVHDFDPNLDDNWWVRFQTYNRFVSAVRKIIIKNRLKK
ncbi:uncharacterized protein LOC112694173, partial [Sipha flava]|uniref:Uncharacterized protein LOC112694173 n=1 Tax=Sipha flava TaxID=143950 RepID=A0A8B8GQ11_9HEMI